jgi:hypothetical protein
MPLVHVPVNSGEETVWLWKAQSNRISKKSTFPLKSRYVTAYTLARDAWKTLRQVPWSEGRCVSVRLT